MPVLAQIGAGGTAPTHSQTGTRRLVFSTTLRPLYHEKYSVTIVQKSGTKLYALQIVTFISFIFILVFMSKIHIIVLVYYCRSRSQWPRGLRRRSAAARLLRSKVWIPPGAWMFVCCVCCVLSGRGLCDELITRPEESYRLWVVVVCDLETSRMRRPWPPLGRSATKKNITVETS
jgi:hypothetical protein